MSFALRAATVGLLLAASQTIAAPAAIAPPAAIPPQVAALPELSLAALKQLESGLWQLDVKGSSPKLVCITDQIRLVQIEHDQPGCSRFVIANDPKSSTVHYSCQRTGWGRTTVRVQSPTLATIQTQGIAHNAPFDYSLQARRVGGCTAQTAAK